MFAGVVDPLTLKVHGTANLRVVDASLMPMLIATHPQSTVYAIAERVSISKSARSALSTRQGLTSDIIGRRYYQGANLGILTAYIRKPRTHLPATAWSRILSSEIQ